MQIQFRDHKGKYMKVPFKMWNLELEDMAKLEGKELDEAMKLNVYYLALMIKELQRLVKILSKPEIK